MTRVLGLSFSGHGTAGCLVEDGRVVRAVNLERITRQKFSQVSLRGYRRLLQSVEEHYGVEQKASYFDFFEVFPDLLEYLTGARKVSDAGLDLVVKVPDNIRSLGPRAHPDYQRFLECFQGVRTHFELEHHLCHAYQAFLSSPYEEAAVLTIDGVGEKLTRLGGEAVTASLCVGRGTQVDVLHEVLTPFTIGGMYASFTKYLGFAPEQEGNTMALAAFGEHDFWKQVADVPVLKEGGAFELLLNLIERNHEWNLRMRAYGGERRRGSPIEQSHMNLAYGVQRITEECVLHAARGLAARTGQRRLAIAGGVALNCVANAKILAETPFEEIHVVPNAGDRGLSLGAALYGYHVLLDQPERRPMSHDYLGRSYSSAEARSALAAARGIVVEEPADIASTVAGMLHEGLVVGWFRGGAEFGPRALGHRSIVADPRTRESKRRLDEEIKRREWFRPYAPSVLAERASEYFEMRGPSPYMLQAVMTRPEKREEVAGIVHVDGTARVQAVEASAEPVFHRLIQEFDRRTGVPMVLNTSFNGYGEPIVETPANAVAAMQSMGLDALALDDLLVRPEPSHLGPSGRR